MRSLEDFRKHYSLTPGIEKYLETILTGREEPFLVSRAVLERLKEEAAAVGMYFLAAAVIDDSFIRLYFQTQDGFYIKDIEKLSREPSRDLFLSMLAHNTQLEVQIGDDDFYIGPSGRPN